MGILKDVTNVGVKPELAPVPVIPAVNENLPLSWLEEPAGQVHQGAFACPSLAHNGHGGPGGDVEGEVLQHIFTPIGIPEGHIPELNFPQERLPVFRFGVEHVSVPGLHLRGIPDLGNLVHEAGDPLDGGLEGDELGNVRRRHLDGLENTHGVGGEGGEGSNFQHLLLHHVAAPQEHNGHSQGGEEEDQGNVDGV